MFKDAILDSIYEIIKNKEVYLVGGYLRNYFLNNEISADRDLVVVGDSRTLATEIAEKLDGTFIELDNINEIYRVVLKDKTNYFDISKALNNNLEEDIKRRDFTINSIFYDLNKKEVFDVTVNAFVGHDLNMAYHVEPLEQVVDDIAYFAKKNHIKRVKKDKFQHKRIRV